MTNLPPTKVSAAVRLGRAGLQVATARPATRQSGLGKVVLVVLGARLLHLHHHGLHGDLFLAVAAVQLVVLVLRGVAVLLGARRPRHGAEGVGAGGGQGTQQRGALRHLLVLLGAALSLL